MQGLRLCTHRTDAAPPEDRLARTSLNRHLPVKGSVVAGSCSSSARRTPTGAEALTTDQLREPLTKLRVSETCAESDQVDPIIRRGDAYTAPQVAVPGGAIGAPGPTKGQPRPLRVL